MAGMRIFDTFLFDGELSLLAHRLAETSDLVDVYVLVEAGETFRGEAKRLAFAEARERRLDFRFGCQIAASRIGESRVDGGQLVGAGAIRAITKPVEREQQLRRFVLTLVTPSAYCGDGLVHEIGHARHLALAAGFRQCIHNLGLAARRDGY